MSHELDTQYLEALNSQEKPALYSDYVNATTLYDGIVLDFGTSVGNTDTIDVIARIGMTKTRAKALIEVLEQRLKEGEK